MLKHGRRHLTYANVTATLALFVTLGGSSYAALKITGRDVRNNSLTGRDIRELTSRDIRDGSLLARDLASGELPGPTKFVVRSAYTGQCAGEGCAGPERGADLAFAVCGPGEQVSGGGVVPNRLVESVVISAPALDRNGWVAGVRHPTEGGSWGAEVYVICASPTVPASE